MICLSQPWIISGMKFAFFLVSSGMKSFIFPMKSIVLYKMLQSSHNFSKAKSICWPDPPNQNQNQNSALRKISMNFFSFTKSFVISSPITTITMIQMEFERSLKLCNTKKVLNDFVTNLDKFVDKIVRYRLPKNVCFVIAWLKNWWWTFSQLKEKNCDYLQTKIEYKQNHSK